MSNKVAYYKVCIYRCSEVPLELSAINEPYISDGCIVVECERSIWSIKADLVDMFNCTKVFEEETSKIYADRMAAARLAK